jgi:hypothetical protein
MSIGFRSGRIGACGWWLGGVRGGIWREKSGEEEEVWGVRDEEGDCEKGRVDG